VQLPLVQQCIKPSLFQQRFRDFNTPQLLCGAAAFRDVRCLRFQRE
jgi:hypothetical protein